MRAASLLFSLVLVACQPEAPPAPVPGQLPTGGEVIGHADDLEITQAMVDSVTSRIPADQLEMLKTSGRWSEFMERIALGQILYQRAIAEGLHEDPDVQLALAMSARDVLAAELIDDVGEKAVTDEAIAEEYEARAVRYARQTVHARHIVVRELDKAEELKEELERGADFTALAATASLDPGTREKGGDLGWFEKERMFREIAEPAFAAEPGTLLGPIETRMGYHLVLVEGKRDATPLDEVRDEIADDLKERAVQDYIEEMQKSVTVEWAGEEKAAEGEGATTEGEGATDGHEGTASSESP